jgi:hypothetical protein
MAGLLRAMPQRAAWLGIRSLSMGHYPDAYADPSQFAHPRCARNPRIPQELALTILTPSEFFHRPNPNGLYSQAPDQISPAEFVRAILLYLAASIIARLIINYVVLEEFLVSYILRLVTI